MARPSLRAERRAEITAAFERVFAARGHEGATVAAVATEAGVSPGIIHHYFRDKDELVHELLRSLRLKSSRRFRGATSLEALLDAALRVGSRADPTAASAWVGIFAVALRAPDLRRTLQRDLRTILHRYEEAADGDADLALGLLATTVGFLLLGPELRRVKRQTLLKLRIDRSSASDRPSPGGLGVVRPLLLSRRGSWLGVGRGARRTRTWRLSPRRDSTDEQRSDSSECE